MIWEQTSQRSFRAALPPAPSWTWIRAHELSPSPSPAAAPPKAPKAANNIPEISGLVRTGGLSEDSAVRCLRCGRYMFRDRPGEWFRGTLAKQNGDCTAAIDFDDGDKFKRCPVAGDLQGCRLRLEHDTGGHDVAAVREAMPDHGHHESCCVTGINADGTVNVQCEASKARVKHVQPHLVRRKLDARFSPPGGGMVQDALYWGPQYVAGSALEAGGSGIGPSVIAFVICQCGGPIWCLCCLQEADRVVQCTLYGGAVHR